MDLDNAAIFWKHKLESGRALYQVRVRRLLEIAGAERRGWVITNRIREVLEVHGLETEPDFGSAWIDGFVRIKLKNGLNSQPVNSPDRGSAADTGDTEGDEPDPYSEREAPESYASTQVADELNSPPDSPGLIETAVAPLLDPVARISSIPSANRGVVSVLLVDELIVATTLMRFEGYSQLAIMQNEREVRGMISWESIAKRSLMFPAQESLLTAELTHR